MKTEHVVLPALALIVVWSAVIWYLVHQNNEYHPPQGSETYYCLHGNSDCYTVGY